MTDSAGSSGAVHVACCFDRKMELSFLVLANSLKRHLSGDRSVVLHAFHSDPLAHDTAYFAALNSASVELRLRRIENRFRGAANWPGYLTPATLLRLRLPSLLKDIDRVVYLDCDLVVLSDIATLYETDLRDLPLAACLDFWLTGPPPYVPPGWEVGAWHTFLREVVGLDDHKAYFNAGVLVIDLAKFRRDGLIEAADDFLERTQHKTAFVDQDALNHVVNGAFVRLNSRWNVLGNRSEIGPAGADGNAAPPPLPDDSYPWIIHYAGPYKPWNCDGRRFTRWNRRFWQEAAQSPVLPLLVRDYLQTCERRGLTRLQPVAALLSSGKPRLHRHDILAQAAEHRFFADAAQATASIVRDLDRPFARTDAVALLSAEAVSHRGGIRDDATLIFDLNAVDGAVIFGPYLWYPVGAYEATFVLAARHVVQNTTKPATANKLTIDIIDDSGRYLAQRDLSLSPSPTECTLQFAVDRNELFVAFRVLATGFAGGELRFGGVSLRARALNQT